MLAFYGGIASLEIGAFMKKILFLSLLSFSIVIPIFQDPDEDSLTTAILRVEEMIGLCGNLKILPEEYTNTPELLMHIERQLQSAKSHAIALLLLAQRAQYQLKNIKVSSLNEASS